MSIIDPDKLMDHLEGDLELLQEAFGLFLEESQGMQSDLGAAVDRTDFEAIHSLAHSFKGMLSNFFAKAPCDTLIQIEETAGSDTIKTHQLLDDLSGQLDMMAIEIRQILGSSLS